MFNLSPFLNRRITSAFCQFFEILLLCRHLFMRMLMHLSVAVPPTCIHFFCYSVFTRSTTIWHLRKSLCNFFDCVRKFFLLYMTRVPNLCAIFLLDNKRNSTYIKTHTNGYSDNQSWWNEEKCLIILFYRIEFFVFILLNIVS